MKESHALIQPKLVIMSHDKKRQDFSFNKSLYKGYHIKESHDQDYYLKASNIIVLYNYFVYQCNIL